MSEETLLESFRDLVHNFIYSNGEDVSYGETVMSNNGTYTVLIEILKKD